MAVDAKPGESPIPTKQLKVNTPLLLQGSCSVLPTAAAFNSGSRSALATVANYQAVSACQLTPAQAALAHALGRSFMVARPM